MRGELREEGKGEEKRRERFEKATASLRLPFLYLKERNKRIYISLSYMVATGE
jgi:hypothetical protein